jgi:lysophospholipase L1-like esterase
MNDFVSVVGADDAAMPYLRWNMALHDGIQDFCTRHRDITALLFSSYATFHQILTSPAQYGFSSADLGLRGGRIWLDHIHPSSAVHDVLARDLAEFLNSIPPS